LPGYKAIVLKNKAFFNCLELQGGIYPCIYMLVALRGLRTAFKWNIAFTFAELVYDTLQLPSEFFDLSAVSCLFS